MGSACCVAARDHTLPARTSSEAIHRNIRYSPSWSFRWDNRVAGEVGNPPSQCSHVNLGNAGLEIKDRMDVEREDISEGGSPLENFRRSTWQKPAVHDGAIGNLTTPASDLSTGSSFSTEVKDSIELSTIAEPSAVAGPSAPKLSFSTPSTSSMSMQRDLDPSISQNYLVHGDLTPSRWARRSPGHQLFRGISDSRILGLKSPNNNSVSEGRQSFVLSTCSNDLTLGSQCGSSDGWSMRTFSELVASSQRDRWSFDSETLDSSRGKITRSNSRLFASPSIDLKTCGVCSKLLTERSSWTSQKIVANEISVVAVLVCGHAYHAECLENMTSETERYDPSCPACSVGEKQALKMSGKHSREADLKVRNNWISRNRIVDGDVDGNSVLSVNNRKRGGTDVKGPKMSPSSSMKNSFVKPFLRRHFSLGSKPMNELSARRKGFWARYH